MSDLGTAVQARIPTQILVELTHPRGGSTPSSVDSTVLEQACTSIQAYFETYAQEAYDGDVTIHVEVCVRGVAGLLRLWGSGHYEGSREFWTGFKEDCDAVRVTRARARITPTTNSEVTPSDENLTGETLRPWSDDTWFRGLVGRRPREGNVFDSRY